MKWNGRHGTELKQIVPTSSSIVPKQLAERVWWLNRPSSQSSPRFSFFRFDSHYIKVWHSIYPTGNAVLSQSARRCFSPLQAEIAPKSPFLCVNRSLIWCVPAKELSLVKCKHMKVEMILAVECWTFWVGNCFSDEIAFIIATRNFERAIQRPLERGSPQRAKTNTHTHLSR